MERDRQVLQRQKRDPEGAHEPRRERSDDLGTGTRRDRHCELSRMRSA
jgi:hypothetical protein